MDFASRTLSWVMVRCDLLHSWALLHFPLRLLGLAHRRCQIVENFVDDTIVVLTLFAWRETNQKEDLKHLLTSFLSHSKPFLAPDGFIFNIFFLVPKTPSSSAQLWMMGQCGVECKEHGGDPLPCQRWPYKVKGGYRQIVNPNEHET